jgi:pyridoxal phosphate enzyme (YggS family)
MVAENILRIKQEIGQNVDLVVVSKYRTIEEIKQVYDAGMLHLAENRVQALLERKEALPDNIKWHLIGHLQTNKVKYIAPFIHLIQSVDSFKLLEEINKQGLKNNRVINCLLQVYIATEDSKFGLSEEELYELINHPQLSEFKNINITGLMGMASNTDNIAQVEKEFKQLRHYFDHIKSLNLFPNFQTVSMGMSGDYLLAIQCGSNMIRVGSKVFE